jgi:pyruvate ferredoxin oxidoreductase beta subunit
MTEKKTTALNLTDEEFVFPGNRACAGCGLSALYRIGLKAIGRDAILIVPPSCLTVMQGLYPIASTQLSVLNVTFASAASAASGVRAALKAKKNDHTRVVAWAGDGGTADIGIQALSRPALRHDPPRNGDREHRHPREAAAQQGPPQHHRRTLPRLRGQLLGRLSHGLPRQDP